MTSVACRPVRKQDNVAGSLLIAGIVIASLTEAIAGTALSLGRSDIMGDVYATPDEFAFLNVGYIAFKMTGFAFAPWLLTRMNPYRVLLAATLAMGFACAAAAAATTNIDLLFILRLVQGLAGAVLLISGQAILFWTFPTSRQPVVQAIFAMGAVVAPATLAPALQGWLLDHHSWTWIFFGVFPISLGAAGVLILAGEKQLPSLEFRTLDWPGLLLLGTLLFSATYILTQGSRWDWFAESRIRWLSLVCGIGFSLFVIRQRYAQHHVFDFSIFKVDAFAFAFVVSFVAGAALFGSGFLITAFATSVLQFTPTEAGMLLLPSGAVFICTLLFAAFLFQTRGLSPLATVPVGILAIMTAMWMLSGSNLESGVDDMIPAILVRGLGLGCLFLSITLIAFNSLTPAHLAFGIGIFNIGRQFGGMLGVSGLQTLIDHQAVANQTVLGAALSPGITIVAERIASTSSFLIARGMEAAAATKAATAMIGRGVGSQGIVIAFDTAFNSVALFFFAAVPVIIAVKIGLARIAARRSLIDKPAGVQ